MPRPDENAKLESQTSWFANIDHVVGALITVAFALGLYILAWIASDNVHEHELVQHWLDIGVLTFGVLCGWLLGTIVSPSIAKEAERFSKAATAASSFISGFVLSKAGDIITMISTRDYWTIANTFRLLMWLTGLLLGMMTTYVLRAYLLPSAAGIQKEDEAENKSEDTPPLPGAG